MTFSNVAAAPTKLQNNQQSAKDIGNQSGHIVEVGQQLLPGNT